MTHRLPWHPVLFGTTVVVTLWLDAAVSPFAIFRSLAASIAISLIVWLAATLISRSLQWGAIVASALVGVLWSKQLIASATEVALRMGGLALVWGILIAIAGFLAVRISLRSRRRITVDGATMVLNRASLLLLVATLILGVTGGRLGSLVADLGQGAGLNAWPAAGASAATGPDIYAVLLDGYPRADVLNYAFDLDNSDFLDALTARGFRVATASHSDYLWTHISVPSALNLAYVEQIPGMRAVAGGTAPRQPTLRDTITSNQAFDVARDHGYTTVGVASGFEQVAPRLADVYIDGGELNEFEVSLLSSTFAGDIVNLLTPDFASGQQRDRIRGNLAVLPQIAAKRDRGPALVFAHVPAPHQPTVFGDDGRPVAVPISPAFFADSPVERDEDLQQFRDRYRAQLPYLNELVLTSIDGILANSEQPPVIILFADHGSASAVDWNTESIAEADPARLLERTGSFFAALTPGHPDLYPDDISPVDIFRLLFDAYYGTDYGRATLPKDGGEIPAVDASAIGD